MLDVAPPLGRRKARLGGHLERNARLRGGGGGGWGIPWEDVMPGLGGCLGKT